MVIGQANDRRTVRPGGGDRLSIRTPRPRRRKGAAAGRWAVVGTTTLTASTRSASSVRESNTVQWASAATATARCGSASTIPTNSTAGIRE